MCPNATTTLGFGSISIEDCGCETGNINMASEGLQCVACGEGIVCPFASTVDGLQNGISKAGEKYVPTIAEGYYSHLHSPTSASVTLMLEAKNPGRVLTVSVSVR